MKGLKHGILSIILLLSINSCFKNGEIDPYYSELYLYADYTYLPGDLPQIEINLQQSSSAIKIDTGGVSIAISASRVEMNFHGIRIFDELGVYEILDIVTEEYRDDKWEVDVENFLKAEKTAKLDFVLVLDVSSSLGADVYNVKQYAKSFIRLVFEENPESRIGIIGFSESVYIFPLSNNISNAYSFIDNLEIDKDATKLFEAIDNGIDLLFNEDSEGKALVTFTDGRNNHWSDEAKYSSANYIVDRINQPTANNVMISSFTIGLEGKGGIDENALRSLALNGGIYNSTSDIETLEKIFDKFANSVASIYTFSYDRNNSHISKLNIRFKIQTQLF